MAAESARFKGAQQPHRVPTLRTSDSPGPGEYAVDGLGSVGTKVADSRRATAAAYSFGSSRRDGAAKQYTDKRTDRSGGRPNFTTSGVQFHETENLHSIGSGRSPVKKRAPAYGFGTTTREQMGKTYLKGQEHLKPNTTAAASDSFMPHGDPVAQQRGNSLVKNSPRFGFGKATRDAWYSTSAAGTGQRGSARPNKLTSTAQFLLPASSIGEKSADSRRPTTPAFSFGSARRDAGAGRRKAVTAGVDFRPPTASIGSEEGSRGDSRKPRSAAYGFGTSTREHYNKMAAKVRPGERPSDVTQSATMLDPLSDCATSTGRMLDSRKATLPSYGFGTSSRDHASRMVFKPHF